MLFLDSIMLTSPRKAVYISKEVIKWKKGIFQKKKNKNLK